MARLRRWAIDAVASAAAATQDLPGLEGGEGVFDADLDAAVSGVSRSFQPVSWIWPARRRYGISGPCPVAAVGQHGRSGRGPADARVVQPSRAQLISLLTAG